MRRPLLALAVLAAACAGPPSGPVGRPDPRAERASAFDARVIRQPAVVVRVEIATRPAERQAASWPAEYEGVLLEGLNARAVPARDARLLSARDRIVPAEALARAREVGADHVLLVNARLYQSEAAFCRDARPFRAVVAVWSQSLRVMRVSDGAVTYETRHPIEVPAMEADCEAPRESRPRTRAEHLAAAVDTLLKNLLGP